MASSPPPVEDLVEVRDADPHAMLAFLERLAADSRVPPVDEDELRRLTGHAPVRDHGWDWAGHLVVHGADVVGYAGVRTPPTDRSGCAARVDLAIDPGHADAQLALGAALAHLRSHAAAVPLDASSGTRRDVEAWLRGASAADLATAAAAGFRERRRLHVLGADATAIARAAPTAPEVPAGLRLRTFDPTAPADTAAVTRLLARVYATAADDFEAGVPVRLASDWFRAEDLLLAESTDTGALLALHWMKRRGDDVGEVHNLAVDPDARGGGLGALLLDTGLAHLLAVGSRDVVLWVDAANAPAIALYRSRGFTHRWDDVSLVG